MRIIFSILLIIACLLLFGLAIKNVEPVELQYYLGLRWRAPLSFMLLTSLLVGVIIGMIICLKTIIEQRKQLLSLQRELKTLNNNNQS